MGSGRNEGPESGDPGTSGDAIPYDSNEPRQFPPAAQPEIMRAAEKDDQYASYVYDACRDAFRHLFGLVIWLNTLYILVINNASRQKEVSFVTKVYWGDAREKLVDGS